MGDPDLRPPGDWVDLAACAGAEQEAFFPRAAGTGKAGDYSRGKVYCRRCPVIAECLDYALNHVDRGATYPDRGLWGGLEPWERQAIRKRRT